MFIREYEGHKYKISHTEGSMTISATSSFAGIPIEGVAKCSPEDTFDLETGIKLAIMRCDVKIGKRKCKRAEEKIERSRRDLSNAKIEHEKVMDYRYAAKNSLNRAETALSEFRKSL